MTINDNMFVKYVAHNITQSSFLPWLVGELPMPLNLAAIGPETANKSNYYTLAQKEKKYNKLHITPDNYQNTLAYTIDA